MKLLLTALLALVPFTLAFTTPAGTGIGRIAISHDGNYHDKDDIGAAAMMQALIWKAGIQDSLVHFDHSSHRGANDVDQHMDMIISSTRALFLYDIDRSKIFDDFLEIRESVLNLAAQINASTAEDRLTILQAGPWEVMALAFDNSDPAKHQFVKIVSHSTWNDNHQHSSHHRNKALFFDQYETGGKWEGVTPPDYEKIDDQNGYAFKSSLSSWSWMSASLETFFVLWRTTESGFAQGDMSDAGMLFWLITGEEHPTMGDVRDFFEL
jgi:hypothetical protein